MMTGNETIKVLELLEFCKSIARSGEDVLLTPNTIFSIDKIIKSKDKQLEAVKLMHINDVKQKDAEIERLQKANESFSCLGMLYSEIKAEARKEFADEFLEKLNQENDLYVRCAKNLLSEDFQRGYEEKNDDVVKIVRHLLKEVETDEE